MSWGAGLLGQLGNGKREDNSNVSDITKRFLPPNERIVHVGLLLLLLLLLYYSNTPGVCRTSTWYGSNRHGNCVRDRRR